MINMVKKIIAAITAIIMSASAVAMAQAPFSDISGHWAEGYITKLANKGVVDGVTDTTFVPDGKVTRAQYLKMIMETLDIKTKPAREGECLDVAVGEWYAPYVQAALDSGLIPSSMVEDYSERVEYKVDENGTATETKVIYSGRFNPNTAINRQEIAVLTQYIYQVTRTILTNEEVDISSVKGFADGYLIGDWAMVSVTHAVANGFMDGMDDNMFRPLDFATRAQAATVISRVIDKVEK